MYEPSVYEIEQTALDRKVGNRITALELALQYYTNPNLPGFASPEAIIQTAAKLEGYINS